MSQSATERFHKLGREALAARFEHARIGKEVGFGAGRFTAGEIVHARFPAKQRAYIHKNVEDLIFAASYFDAIGGSFLELAPFRKQPRRLGRVSIKAQHKVTQFFQIGRASCRVRVSDLQEGRRRHTRCLSDWSSDVCSSDLASLSWLHFANSRAVWAGSASKPSIR